MDNMYHSRRRQPGVRKRVKVFFVCIVLFLLGLGVFQVLKTMPFLWDTVTKKEIALKKTPEKKINILILGVGGGDHDGPDLTDTIIFAAIDPEKKKVQMVSLPRDLWNPEINAKINSTYTLAEEKEKGTGLEATKERISYVLGQPIDYAVKINFDGFVKAVNMVGGLDVKVDRTLDDYAYPREGRENDPCGLTEEQIASVSAQIASGSAGESESFPCRYEHLHVGKGNQHLDGVTALKFVRSRHAMGKEGSDFSRSKRQEKVISAFKQKIFSVGTILNPAKASSLFAIFKENLEMDIKESEYDDFIRLAQSLKGASIKSTVIDTGDGEEERFGLLINPPISPLYGMQWVLAPRAGADDYTEIQQYVACYLKGKNCMVGETGIVTPTPKPTRIPTPTDLP